MAIALLCPPWTAVPGLQTGDTRELAALGYGVLDGALPPAFLWQGALEARASEERRWLLPRLFIDVETGIVVGGGGFKNAPGCDGWVEVGYGVAPVSRGRGFGTAAIRALVARAFRAPGVRGVKALVAEGNVASARVLEKTGFSLLGRDVDAVEGPVRVYGRHRFPAEGAAGLRRHSGKDAAATPFLGCAGSRLFHDAAFPPMKTYRLNRLFHPRSRRCLDVAVDHGFFNELSFLNGIEDLVRAVDVLVQADPDAIQLTVGQASVLQERPGKGKPALVLRTDVANVYGSELPRTLFSRILAQPVEQALRLDAACVVVNLFRIPGQPEVTDQCVQNILALKPECERYGMPLMIEPLVFRPNEQAGGYQVDGDLRKILPLVRQAVELGADVIKADPTDDLEEYHRVVEIARVPVLVRGGGRADDGEVLRRTATVIAQGAAGIVYGRNIIQHPNPFGMTQALLSIVHDGATPETAAEWLGRKPGA